MVGSDGKGDMRPSMGFYLLCKGSFPHSFYANAEVTPYSLICVRLSASVFSFACQNQLAVDQNNYLLCDKVAIE